MKNPLRKRYLRELKTDFGKYLVIFLFLILLISLTTGFLVVDKNFKQSYDEGFVKYNIEDGHIAFDQVPSEELLAELEEKGDLKFYDLAYFEEDIDENGKTLRVYKKRNEVNIECLMEGNFPEKENDIAIDRMFAKNNDIRVGDTIEVYGKTLTVCGFIAAPDYSCLFENNTDMMFDAINFGIGVMTDEGYDYVGSKRITYNYAWKYNKTPKDDIEENEKSEAFLDDLEDVLKDHAEVVIQAQVDELYDKATDLETTLEDQLEVISDDLEEQLEDAGEKAVKKSIKGLGSSKVMNLFLDKAGMSKKQFVKKIMSKNGITEEQVQMAAMMSGASSDEELFGVVVYLSGMNETSLMNMLKKEAGLSDEDTVTMILEAYASKKGVSKMDLVAAELDTDTTGKSLDELTNSLDEFEDKMDEVKTSTKPQKVDLDALEDDENYENDMDFSMDDLQNVIDKIAATNMVDVSKVQKTVDALTELSNTKIDETDIVEVEDYVARYNNQGINFTGEDMGKDSAMMTIFNYLVIVIIAFVFAVTVSSTITKESCVIGTLRATGFSKREMILHYLTLPVWVTFLGAVIGNILGYTYFSTVFVNVYYGSYSLATYENRFIPEVLIHTTVLPVVLMFVINLFVLIQKMQFTPLQFLRRQLSKKRKKKTMPLNKKLPFLLRFRLRVLFQNIPAYITLSLGIFLGAVIVIFGNMFGELFDVYGERVMNSRICDYQYIMMDQVETDSKQAEKFWMKSLDLSKEGFLTDSITIYGIEPDSIYINKEIPDGKVLISNGISEKFGLGIGDELVLEDHFSSKKYKFEIGGIYQYDAVLSIFVNKDDYLEKFNEKEDEFVGFFSNELLEDLQNDDVATIVTVKSLTKIVDQMKTSMGEMMSMFSMFGVIMFLLLMFLMTKQILEKNQVSISMTKILGFKDGEIGGLYLAMTFVVVLVSLLVCVPIVDVCLRIIFDKFLYTMMTGYMPFIVSSAAYVKMVVLGILSFIIVTVFMMIKINKVPKSEALKNVE